MSELVERVLAEVLRDAHRYAPGLEHDRPTLNGSGRSGLGLARERMRDRVERLAGRAGFARRHFDADVAGRRLTRILELAPGLESTYAELGDECSRRRLADVLKLRVLGPYHAPLATTPQQYRAKQDYAERSLMLEEATFEVSDPWFSPLSLYEVPLPGGETIRLHSHSVDVVSVFLLGQYTYEAGGVRVATEAGDVVIDGGGCYGDTALLFASRVGPGGKVFVFEFDPENLAVLRANLELNPKLADRIEVVERALWDVGGDTLTFAHAGRATTVDTGAGGSSEVLTLTLDGFVSDSGLERVDYVKTDVEGAEPNVLRGAAATLQRFAPRLALAAYHRDDDLVRLPEMLRGLGVGYRFFVDTFSPLEDETVLFAHVP